MSGLRYIKLILPLQLEWEPCYSTVSPSVRTGDRVGVRFANRHYIGVVSECDVVPDVDPSRIQGVGEVSTGLPPVGARELELWRFIADYYLCSIGEVYKAAYPYGKTAAEESGARARKHKQLMDARAEALWRERIAKLRARLQAKEQAISGRHTAAVLARLEEERQRILKDLGAAEAGLNAINRTLAISDGVGMLIPEEVRSMKADSSIATALAGGKPVLLISGNRYDNYIQLAATQLTRGRNVLITVPETALAKELQEKMHALLGDILLVSHSGDSGARRRETADAVRSGRPYVLIGTRSSIFLPHRDLGLIVVDDEQSPFYKQTEGSPRYNARDCAVQLSRIHGCSILLGSSSPSLESLLNARNGRYTLVDKRSGKDGAGTFRIIDIAAERKKNGMAGPFSRKLLQAVADLPEGQEAVYIRGFERLEELPSDANVLSIPQAARTDLRKYALVAMLSADALFDPGDFRADERAWQYLDALRSRCPDVIVQTAQGAHPVFSLKDPWSLMEERRTFGLPPFTRMVDVLLPHGAEGSADDLCASLKQAGFNALSAGPDSGGRLRVRVTLPKDRNLRENKLRLRELMSSFKDRLGHRINPLPDVDPA